MGADIKVGDRVRVTVEAEVGWVSAKTPGRFHIYLNGNEVAIERPGVEGITVEKIEPPAEVFRPGDVVRNSAWTYALGTDGFLTIASAYGHPVGTFSRYGENGKYEASDFTTKWFERVNPDSPAR